MESERDVLLFFLDRVRDAVVRASAGLTGEQQWIRGVPSGTNLLGLRLAAAGCVNRVIIFTPADLGLVNF